MKQFVVVASLLALSCGGSAESEPPPTGNGVAVLELFTSQGCSSCPPADALLSRLDDDPALRGRVIPLAFHVDYWNYIGWSDPYSSRDWSERQRAYSRRIRADVYTPQLIVNGMRSVVGSSGSAVRRAIAERLAEEPKARLQVVAMKTSAGTIAVDVKGLQSTDAPLEVWIAVVESDLVTNVARGENRGRMLENDNVVRVLRRATTLEPHGRGMGHVEIGVDNRWNLENLRIVAFAQNGTTLQIEGAAATRVPVL
jgi:hypothetical protein